MILAQRGDPGNLALIPDATCIDDHLVICWAHAESISVRASHAGGGCGRASRIWGSPWRSSPRRDVFLSRARPIDAAHAGGECAPPAGHRQSAEPSRSPPQCDAVRRPYQGPVRQQSSRGLPPADAATRAPSAAPSRLATCHASRPSTGSRRISFATRERSARSSPVDSALT